MVLSKEDKEILSRACETELARITRAAKAASNPSIRDLLAVDASKVQALAGRIFNEVAK